jgi:hypothetical protein
MHSIIIFHTSHGTHYINAQNDSKLPTLAEAWVDLAVARQNDARLTAWWAAEKAKRATYIQL